MTTTISNVSSTEMRARLVELHELPDQCASLERRIESKARDLQLVDFGDDMPSRYFNAFAGQLKGALDDATKEGGNEWDPRDVARELAATIEILDFAIERGERDAI